MDTVYYYTVMWRSGNSATGYHGYERMGEGQVRFYERDEPLLLGLSILKTQSMLPSETWKTIGNIGIRVTIHSA